MAYSEHIGKVVGEDGKTYVPNIKRKENTINAFDITFTEKKDVEPKTLIIPMLKAVRNDKNRQIEFRYEEDVIQGNTNTNISFDDIRGEDGKAGTIKVSPLTINSENITKHENENNTNVFYTPLNVIPSNITDPYSTLYIINSDNTEIDKDTYFPEKQENKIKWTRISDFINIDNYVPNSEYIKFKNTIETKVGQIIDQQQSIYDILVDGIDDNTPAEEPEEQYVNLNAVRLSIFDDEQEGYSAYNFIADIFDINDEDVNVSYSTVDDEEIESEYNSP